MTHGHRDAQILFNALGVALGYAPKSTYSQALPTDGLWTIPSPSSEETALPVVAIEVIVTESRKTARGSILTLEMVSPALGVLLIHEDELRRRHIRTGGSSQEADRRVASVRRHAHEFAAGSRQRIEVWSVADLRERYRAVTGVASLYQISPCASSTKRAA